MPLWRTTGGQASTDHRYHRSGRLLPRRTPARRRATRSSASSGAARRVTIERIATSRTRSRSSRATCVDEVSLINVLRDHRPNEVYNLAAQSFVQTVVDAPGAHRRDHGARRHAHARRHPARRSRDPLLPGELVRDVRQGPEMPQNETTPSIPAAPTASPRSTATGSPSTTARATACSPVAGSSSTTSRPRRGLEFVTRKVTNGVARIKLGLATELRLGNLDAERDWGYAADYVRAMWRCSSATSPTTSSSPRARPTRCANSARSRSPPRAQLGGPRRRRPAFIRPAEVDLLVGDATKAARRLGWKCEVDFER